MFMSISPKEPSLNAMPLLPSPYCITPTMLWKASDVFTRINWSPIEAWCFRWFRIDMNSLPRIGAGIRIIGLETRNDEHTSHCLHRLLGCDRCLCPGCGGLLVSFESSDACA